MPSGNVGVAFSDGSTAVAIFEHTIVVNSINGSNSTVGTGAFKVVRESGVVTVTHSASSVAVQSANYSGESCFRHVPVASWYDGAHPPPPPPPLTLSLRPCAPGIPTMPTNYWQNVLVTAPPDLAAAAGGLCGATSDESLDAAAPLNRSDWHFPEQQISELEATCRHQPLPPSPPCASAQAESVSCDYPKIICDACTDKCGVLRLPEAMEACAACACPDSFGYQSCLLDYCVFRDAKAVAACNDVHACSPPAGPPLPPA